MNPKRYIPNIALGFSCFVAGIIAMGLYMLIPLNSQRQYSARLEETLKEIRTAGTGL